MNADIYLRKVATLTLQDDEQDVLVAEAKESFATFDNSYNAKQLTAFYTSQSTNPPRDQGHVCNLGNLFKLRPGKKIQKHSANCLALAVAVVGNMLYRNIGFKILVTDEHVWIVDKDTIVKDVMKNWHTSYPTVLTIWDFLVTLEGHLANTEQKTDSWVDSLWDTRNELDAWTMTWLAEYGTNKNRDERAMLLKTAAEKLDSRHTCHRPLFVLARDFCEHKGMAVKLLAVKLKCLSALKTNCPSFEVDTLKELATLQELREQLLTMPGLGIAQRDAIGIPCSGRRKVPTKSAQLI